ncbi:MAG: toluene tolerance protein [Candidatus Pelagibacter sp.]|nr:toluene tolerance protein [Candidatus Pelagibacter sp.]|tara:strand:+ start:1472 stop:2065 length:594 start_codon:yes stop_codon:yes gene_type:complete
MLKKIIINNIIVLFFFTLKAFAFEENAKQLIQITTENAKKIAISSEITIQDKKNKIENIALNVVDVDGLARFTLGSHKKNLNDNQLKKYYKTFRVFFVKNISSRLQNYSNQNIMVTGAKKISQNYVLVNSKMISEKDNQKINIDWRVFKIKEKLVIRDLVVEGLSLAKTQREEINSIIATKGFDGLISNLNDYISKN